MMERGRVMKFLATMAMAMSVSVLAALPAHAQMETREGIALQNQILELRRDIQALRSDQGRAPSVSSSSSLGGGRGAAPVGAGGGEMTAQLLERVDRIENAVRQINGRIDEVDNARSRQGADLAKQIGDLQFKIDNTTPGARPAAPAAPASSVGSQAPTPLGALPVTPGGSAKRTPELALQEGNAALARRDYTVAEASAREVIASGKASPRGYDAQFLLAQAMSGQRNYPQAAVAFGDTYERSKTGAHAQDSLVGLAGSLSSLGEKRSACAALDTLKAQFPSPRQDVATHAATLRTAAGCR